MATAKDKTKDGTNDTKRVDSFMVDPRNIVVIENMFNRTDWGDLEHLAADIAKNGVISPITVIPETNSDGDTVYKLIDGERRYRATMLAIENGADIARIPANKRSRGMTEEEIYAERIKRNEGKNFTDYELARIFQVFVDKGFKQNEIAEKLDQHPAVVSNCLSLLDLAPEIQAELKTDKISASTVKAIVKAVDTEADAVKAVKTAVKTAEDRGKKKATQKDVVDETVVLKNDSKTILKGIEKLVMYMEAADVADEKMYALREIALFLREGKNIDEVLTFTAVKAALSMVS